MKTMASHSVNAALTHSFIGPSTLLMPMVSEDVLQNSSTSSSSDSLSLSAVEHPLAENATALILIGTPP